MAEERRENESKEKQRQQQNGASTQREIARPSVMPLATPFTLMRRFMDDLDQLFSGLSGVSARAARDDTGTAIFAPVLETLERDGQFVVRADVPGVDKEHVHAEIEGQRFQLRCLRIFQGGHDQQDAIGADRARLEHLVGVEHEILAQRGQGAGATRLFQERILALEIRHVGQDRQTGRATRRIGTRQGRRIEIGADQALGG